MLRSKKEKAVSPRVQIIYRRRKQPYLEDTLFRRDFYYLVLSYELCCICRFLRKYQCYTKQISRNIIENFFHLTRLVNAAPNIQDRRRSSMGASTSNKRVRTASELQGDCVAPTEVQSTPTTIGQSGANLPSNSQYSPNVTVSSAFCSCTCYLV